MQTILIIEDELVYRKLLHTKLAELGYRILEAADGKEGLEFALKEKPDLILLDIRMPRMDGLTMIQALRKDAYGKTAKVIFLTNLESDNQIIQQIIAHKPIYYLIKSEIHLSDLVQKIQEVFNEKRE